MNQKERLVEQIQLVVDGTARHWAEVIADYLLDDGWFRPPYKIGAKVYATIGSLSLPIPYAVYEVTIQRYVLATGGLVPVVKLKKGMVTYGDIHTSIGRLYDTREDAEKALRKDGV